MDQEGASHVTSHAHKFSSKSKLVLPFVATTNLPDGTLVFLDVSRDVELTSGVPVTQENYAGTFAPDVPSPFTDEPGHVEIGAQFGLFS